MNNRSPLTVHRSPTSTFEVLVSGESMWPVLVPGKRYAARRDGELHVNDVVVAIHPSDPAQTIVKRVSAISNGVYTLSGTVSWSSTFEVTRQQILGVLVL